MTIDAHLGSAPDIEINNDNVDLSLKVIFYLSSIRGEITNLRTLIDQIKEFDMQCKIANSVAEEALHAT